jgi:hypothetical protein
VVAPEAGPVVDATVGGELLDRVHRPPARGALLRGAAPRPRHPLTAAALRLRSALLSLLSFRPRWKAAVRVGEGSEDGKRRRWVGWMIGEGGTQRQHSSASESWREGAAYNGSAARLVRCALLLLAFC